LVSGAIGTGAERDLTEEVEAIGRTFREKPEVYLKIVVSISPKEYKIGPTDSVGSYVLLFG
jgi:hypothetical protein